MLLQCNEEKFFKPLATFDCDTPSVRGDKEVEQGVAMMSEYFEAKHGK